MGANEVGGRGGRSWRQVAGSGPPSIPRLGGRRRMPGAYNERTISEGRVVEPAVDPAAIERHRGYLTGLARLQLASRPWLAARLDAEDLVQKVMLKAHAARGGFRGRSEGELGAWLRQIVTRTLANELRAHAQAKRDVGAERSLEADLDASSGRLDAWLVADQSSPSERAVGRERAEALAAAVAALPPDQREVVLLKHCHGLPSAEIAARTGRTPAAVAGLLRRGLGRLRELLDQEARP